MKRQQLMVVEYIYKNKDMFVRLLTDTASLSVRKFLSKLLLSSICTVYLVSSKKICCIWWFIHTYHLPM